LNQNIELLRNTIITGFIVSIGIILLFGSWTTINPGYRGVVVRLGAVQKGVLSEGIHFKLTFVDEIEKMNVQIQKDPLMQMLLQRTYSF
jgi:regulator of protease activity HflC (stomatin/prohibitin superfamily)